MPDIKRATGTSRLSDKAIKAWLRGVGPSTKFNGSDMLHDGGGLYLRRRTDGAFWALREVDPVTGVRSWAGLFPGVSYPQASLDAARHKVAEARMRAALHPTSVKRDRGAALQAKRAEDEATDLAARRRVTVRQLFERWAGTDLSPRVSADGSRIGRKDGGEYTRQQFERRVFPAIGHFALQSVTKGDLMAILDKTKAEGKLRTANVVLADMKQMLRFALVRELIERNPLDTVTKRQVGGHETERDRVLSTAEIRALALAVPNAAMSVRGVAAIWLILATGCRISEAMGARWKHVDTVAQTWHLPQTKNEREHTIHLSRFALAQFEALHAHREKDASGTPVPWVFPNAAGDGPVNVKSFGKQLSDRQRPPERRIRGRSLHTSSLMLPGGRWTAHDLRRTAATLMAEMGISGDVIDECLNHVIESRVRRTYIRDRRRVDQARAFDALGARLAALAEGTSVSNVVQLPVAA